MPWILFGLAGAFVAAGCQREESPLDQGFEVTVLGADSAIENLRASAGLSANAAAPYHSGVEFRNVPGTNWSTDYGLQGLLGSLQLKAWLCPSLEVSQGLALAAGNAVEKRTVELDDNNVFWTNGRYGEGYGTGCEWGTSTHAFEGVETFQDGPSLCSEAIRAKTSVVLYDSAQTSSIDAETCVALVGPTANGTISVSLGRTHSVDHSIAFSLWLTHCLPAQPVPPIHVGIEALASPVCTLEEAGLIVGEVTDAGRPKVLRPIAGEWTITAVSFARDGLHVSDLDMTFSDGLSTYRAAGHIELPLVFTD